MNEFVRQIASGLATGGIYASLALAIVMIHQSTHHLNFAQGEMAMFSTFFAWVMIEGGFPYWAAFGVTLVVSFVVGILIERLLMRRFQNSPMLTVVIVLIGLLVIINSVAGFLFGYTIKPFPSPFPAALGSTLVSSHELGMVVVMLLVLLAMFFFFRFTALGLTMRAAAQHPVSSRLLGIRVDSMLALGWGLAAGIGAISGMMAAPIVFLDPNMMNGIILYGFAAALLGGIDNPWGAAAGGFIMGVIENISGAYLVGTELKLTVALLVIVGVLLVKPSGLFSRGQANRV